MPRIPDLIAAIQAEHRQVLDLADQVLDGYGSGSGHGRRALRSLIALESRHEVAEARFLWPVVRDVLPEYAGIRDDARAQERHARRVLHRLHRSGGGPGEEELVERAVRAVIAHVGLEESQVLPSLADRLDLDHAARLGALYEQASASGPTRPHPHVPAVPGLLALAGPLAARTDRMRDLLHLR